LEGSHGDVIEGTLPEFMWRD